MDSQPLLELNNLSFRRVVWVTLVLILIGFGFWLLIRFYLVIFILFSSIIISTVLRPAVNWLSRRGIPPLWGIILVFSVVFLLFIGFLMLFLPMIIEQGMTLFTAVPRYYQNFLEWMINNPNPMLKQLSDTLPVTLPGLIPFQQSGQQMLDSVEKVIIYFRSTIEVIFLTTAIFMLIIHWTLEGSQTIQSLLLLVPKNKRDSI